MSKLLRYDMEVNPENEMVVDCYEYPTGRWVEYDEVEALEKKIAGLERRFKDMPVLDLGFKTKWEMEAWEKWRSKVFDDKGNLKEVGEDGR